MSARLSSILASFGAGPPSTNASTSRRSRNNGNGNDNADNDADDDNLDDDDGGSGALCVVCKTRPRHSKYPTCGMTCASKLSAQNQGQGSSNLCQVCQQKPKHGSYPTCGLTCAAKLQAQGGGGKKSSTPGKKAGNSKASKLCLQCGENPRAVTSSGKIYDFCGTDCRDAANLADLLSQINLNRGKLPRTPQSQRRRSSAGTTMDTNTVGGSGGGGGSRRASVASSWPVLKSQAQKEAPTLLCVPNTEETYKRVLDLFRTDWKSSNREIPKVQRIFMVFQKQDIFARHEQFKERLNLVATNPVHESRRWIGASHRCNISKTGIVIPCTSLNCTLCDIIRRNIFSPNDFPRMIPATGTTNKADKLAFSSSTGASKSTVKAMLLTKVASADEEEMTAEEAEEALSASATGPRRKGFIQLKRPDEGDSNTGEKSSDQLLVFTPDAICPKFLVLYS